MAAIRSSRSMKIERTMKIYRVWFLAHEAEVNFNENMGNRDTIKKEVIRAMATKK